MVHGRGYQSQRTYRGIPLHARSPDTLEGKFTNTAQGLILMPVLGSAMVSMDFTIAHKSAKSDETSGVGTFGVDSDRIQDVCRIELRDSIALREGTPGTEEKTRTGVNVNTGDTDQSRRGFAHNLRPSTLPLPPRI